MIRPYRCSHHLLDAARQKLNVPPRFVFRTVVPVLRLHAHEQVVADDAGVVHQDVEPAPLFHAPRATHSGGVAGSATSPCSAIAVPPAVSDFRRSGSRPPPGCRDRRTRPWPPCGQRLDDGPADAAAAAGDQCTSDSEQAHSPPQDYDRVVRVDSSACEPMHVRADARARTVRRHRSASRSPASVTCAEIACCRPPSRGL